MIKIETFNLNEYLNDYDGLNDLEMGLFEDTTLTVNLISTPSAPFGSETIISLSILALEAGFARELLKIKLTLNSKTWVFHCKFFFPWHVFTINDGNKLDLVLFNPCNVPFVIMFCKPIVLVILVKIRKVLITYN
jgi:hypothetical protein